MFGDLKYVVPLGCTGSDTSYVARRVRDDVGRGEIVASSCRRKDKLEWHRIYARVEERYFVHLRKYAYKSYVSCLVSIHAKVG